MTLSGTDFELIRALAVAQLRSSAPELQPAEAERAARLAAECLDQAPSAIRLGLRTAATLLHAHVLLVERAPFPTLRPADQQRWLDRWESSRLSPLNEVLIAINALALVYAYAGTGHA
jgi:hypothetical protein